MKVAVVPVTPFAQNCSVLVCEETNRAAVIDPGGDIGRILETVEKTDAEVEKILVTHAHVDHVGGVGELAERLGVPIEGPHRDDQFWIDALVSQSRQFGMPPARAFTPDRWLQGGDKTTVGAIELDVRHCPGHTPGHIIFFSAAAKLAFVGDVLFQGSIGRTDFPRGDQSTLIRSIREQLWPLGDDVQFVPGHGPTSTFGEERLSNPFVSDAAQP